MLYLGIDQHARQITVSLRDEGGDVLQARQVSTQPETAIWVVGVARVVGSTDVSNHPGVHRIAAGKAEVRHRRRRSPSYFCGVGVSWLNVSTALARVFRGQSNGLPLHIGVEPDSPSKSGLALGGRIA